MPACDVLRPCVHVCRWWLMTLDTFGGNTDTSHSNSTAVCWALACASPCAVYLAVCSPSLSHCDSQGGVVAAWPSTLYRWGAETWNDGGTCSKSQGQRVMRPGFEFQIASVQILMDSPPARLLDAPYWGHFCVSVWNTSCTAKGHTGSSACSG